MKTLALAAMLAAISMPVAAAPYTLFIYEGAEQLALRPAQSEAAAAYWAAYDAFGKELAAAGVLRGGSALNAGAPVSVVGAAGPAAADAPYAASPLLLGGYSRSTSPTMPRLLTGPGKRPWAGSASSRSGRGIPSLDGDVVSGIGGKTMQYMLMFYETETEFAKRDDSAAAPAYWGAWNAYIGR
jgi:hypothetical protein